MNRVACISLACLVLVAPAAAVTITVPGQQPTIQAGLNACSAGDTVLVSPGTYLENIVWPSTQSLYLKSEAGPEVTIIDGGNLAVPDTGSAIVFAPGLDGSTVLEGFTITHGTGTYYPDFNSYGGGGILCDSTSPTIINNLVTENTERIDVGGGILCMYDCSPVIRGNTITGNRANATVWGIGGGIFCYLAPATIADNVISNNEAFVGCGVALEYDAATSDHLRVPSAATVSGNEIVGNIGLVVEAHGGGIHLFGGYVTIAGNRIADNRARYGGGIRLSYSSPTITDNEITGNVGSDNGGGIQSAWNSTPTITLNEIIGNQGGFGSGTGGISYFCCDYDSEEDAGIPGSFGTIGVPPEGNLDPEFDGRFTANTFTDNWGGAIRCAGNGSPAIELCQIVNNVGEGIVCVNGSTPEIHYNDIVGNAPHHGVLNLHMLMVNAENNWWGDPTGPFHPITNPNGLGDKVSDYVDYTPWSAASDVAEPVSEGVRGRLLLQQNRPNPFTPTTEISYSVPKQALLNLCVYDVNGRMVRALVDGVAEPGVHTVRWDGRDASGAVVPSGIYYYRLAGDGFEMTRAMALVK